MASNLLVAGLLVFVALSGCLQGPPIEEPEPSEEAPGSTREQPAYRGQPSAFEAAERAIQKAESISDAARLVWVGGRETPLRAQTTWEGTSTGWRYGFYDPIQNMTFTIGARADPLPTRFGVGFDELDLAAYVDSTDIAELTRQENGSQFAAHDASNPTVYQAVYWLAAINGTARWTVAFWANETSHNVTVNAETGEIVPHRSEDGGALIPSGFKAADAASRAPAVAWQSDAVLVEAYALELVTGGTAVGWDRTLQFVLDRESGAFVPPDFRLKDGRASVWALRYHSNETSLIRTFLVYGTGDVVSGPETAAPMTTDPDSGERRPFYTHDAQPRMGSVEAAADSVGSMPYPDMRGAYYHLFFGTTDRDNSTRGFVWQISLLSGDMFQTWTFDAQTGELLACPSC